MHVSLNEDRILAGGLPGMWALAFWWAPSTGILTIVVAPYERTIDIAFVAAIGICLVAAEKIRDIRLASVLNAGMALVLFIIWLFLAPIVEWLMSN